MEPTKELRVKVAATVIDREISQLKRDHPFKQGDKLRIARGDTFSNSPAGWLIKRKIVDLAKLIDRLDGLDITDPNQYAISHTRKVRRALSL